MTPQEQQMLKEVYEFVQMRKTQQLTYPIDPVTAAILAIPSDNGLGSTALTQTYSVSGGGGGSITGPKAYSDTFYLAFASGEQYEIPFLSKTP